MVDYQQQQPSSEGLPSIQEAGAPTLAANVIVLAERRYAPERAEPQLSNAELRDLRAMLIEFRMLKESCPMARRLLETE